MVEDKVEAPAPKPRTPLARNVRRLRKERGLSADQLADKAGLSSVKMIESGGRFGRQETLESIAAALGVGLHELFEDSQPIPVVGYIGAVGAGDRVSPAETGREPIDRPSGIRADQAVEVRGDALYPSYRDGQILFVLRDPGLEASWIVGAECLVRVRGGDAFMKTVERGSRPGRYTLTSTHAPPMIDAEIEWAAPVLWVRRRI